MASNKSGLPVRSCSILYLFTTQKPLFNLLKQPLEPHKHSLELYKHSLELYKHLYEHKKQLFEL